MHTFILLLLTYYLFPLSLIFSAIKYWSGQRKHKITKILKLELIILIWNLNFDITETQIAPFTFAVLPHFPSNQTEDNSEYKTPNKTHLKYINKQ